MSDPRPSAQSRFLAIEVRDRFVKEVEKALPSFADIAKRTLQAADVKDGRQAIQMQAASQGLTQNASRWVEGMRQAWQGALSGGETRMGGPVMLPTTLALVGDEEVETRIIASRLSLAVNDMAAQELSDLRVRVRHLDGSQDLSHKDVLHPDVLTRMVIEQWLDVGMSREAWAIVHEPLRAALAQLLTEAYHQANAFLIEQGVLQQIDLRPLMRRAADVGPAGASAGGRSGAAGQPAPGGPAVQTVGGELVAGGGPGLGGWSVAQGSVESVAAMGQQSDVPGTIPGAGGVVHVHGMPSAELETRLLTALTPMLRMRQRAQGVLGQLRRLLSDRIDDFDAAHPLVPSPGLVEALRTKDDGFPATILLQREPGGTVNVGLVARYVDERADKLKKRTDKEGEKAIVEVVALMFQAILAEERIPPVVRVWFARLQIPVLRVAMVDPDFFSSMDHPARQLIDRMGACVLGFDAAGLQGGRLEAEIRRVVQVIEQYPETGKRVFQLVFDEFKKFLTRHLAGGDLTQRVVSIAQQVEQKDALSIQYTIELRKLLDTMPVSDVVREFVFKVWADVMAMGAVRHGGQHAETLALKRTATDLVWAASPKPTSRERTAVIQALPNLLSRLRKGMDMLNLAPDTQEGHIKSLNDAVAQAFLNRANAITTEQIEQLARSLASLEDVVTDDAAGDVMLDPTSIELMLGVDASALEVITHGGSDPSEGMLAWARELEIGQWFQLHHLDQSLQVQYAWRSERGQIHLFTTAAGHSYLIQARRLASFLQAGLIYPTEEEALTVRATRMAIAKLEAEPTRLL
ncbi:hypothetical protein CCO03_18575 [Comamonas serinivorans]|uniref:Thymidine phosphorylase n=1 Tax=Comamonas serinivorans TaxID=1082851 RepID=A0A1Y0ERV0_9BURK|nr:DUF1631 family protein [Comamonas serinivorans]ARU06395.1 hypothetical protein CCO03_18575 [Comamonas serinivorans]